MDYRTALIRTSDGELHGARRLDIDTLLEMLTDPNAVVVVRERNGDSIHIPVRSITAVTVSDRD